MCSRPVARSLSWPDNFHLRDGIDLILDEEGRDCDDLLKVAHWALLHARSIISSDAHEGRVRLDQRIDVEDPAGTLVHRLLFTDAVTIVYPPATSVA